ncbi:MAG: cyclase [Chthoniobacteraceae bacterium]|nr:cyclase [Chthoniobacteraceae bacterium]
MHVKTILHSVEIVGKTTDVYEAWTDFENYPSFMEGVREVRRIDDRRYLWISEFDGARVAWECAITLLIPHQRIAWRVVGDDGASGSVTIEPAGENKTRVTFRLTYGNDAPWGAISEAAMRQRVCANLRRFKRLFEKGHALKRPVA